MRHTLRAKLSGRGAAAGEVPRIGYLSSPTFGC
jgi:hypothetical protein